MSVGLGFAECRMMWQLLELINNATNGDPTETEVRLVPESKIDWFWIILLETTCAS